MPSEKIGKSESAPTNKIARYNALWPLGTSDLQIEMACIVKGGQWEKNGKKCGAGLFHHYKETQKLIWPEDDHHRWSDLILEEYLKNRITILMGSRDSSKTRSISKAVLIDYYCFPDDTLALMTSTNMRGLELRCWGDVKSLHQRALDRYPDLPGNISDSKHGIFTDAIEETGDIRDQRKGILCFVAGTMVETSNGPVPIELLKAGGEVVNAVGIGKIKSTHQRIAQALSRITLSDGRVLECTPEHPIFTQRGWIKAACLKTCDMVFSANETMRLLRGAAWPRLPQPKTLLGDMPKLRATKTMRLLREDISRPQAKAEHAKRCQILQHGLLGKVGSGTSCFEKADYEKLPDLRKATTEGPSQSAVLQCSMSGSSGARHMSRMRQRIHFHHASEDSLPDSVLQSILQAEIQWEEVGIKEQSPNANGDFVGLSFSSCNSTPSVLHREEVSKEHSSQIRNGLGIPGNQTERGDRRRIPSNRTEKGIRCRKDSGAESAWVESVTLLNKGDCEEFRACCGGYSVYNLEITGHPSYTANGIVVHNCVPCIGSHGEYMGESLKDFCFVGGTLVDTPDGQVPIEQIREGDLVFSAIGASRVIATSSRIAPQVVTVHLTTGEEITCTPDHPFLTVEGFVNALDILPQSKLLSLNATTIKRVDRVEILQLPSEKECVEGEGCYRVFNLEVADHPTYSVHGVIVHNCGIKQKRRRLVGDELSFIPREYLKVLDSLDKGDFKAAFCGNPIAENGKALDTVSEPRCGWGSQPEVTKTTVWDNKYNGRTINLVGIDSPNFDQETLNKFPYLVDQSDVDRVSNRPGGRDSIEWWSQIMGVRKAGAVSNSVLTVPEIQACEGFKQPIWGSKPRTKIYAIDAGFGGDECVETWLEFGEFEDGRMGISFGDQRVIPILLSLVDDEGERVMAEKQIAKHAKLRCDVLGVHPTNVFFDAGMYATLAIAMAREMSSEVNAVNFGGVATDRPVSSDMFMFEHDEHRRRLKTWYEHVSKFVTELWFVVRLVTQCHQIRQFPRDAAEEFSRRQWTYVSRDRYEIETKDDYKLRNGGESPNRADSLVIAVEGARRRGFQIKKMGNAETEQRDNEWLKDLARSATTHTAHELVYT